jgi:hypothetical protein
VSEFDTLLVDELRREFRRTRPPAKALESYYTAGIFRLSTPYQIGFRVFWFPAELMQPLIFSLNDTLFELIEPLPV